MLVAGWIAVLLGTAGAFSADALGTSCLVAAAAIAAAAMRGSARGLAPRKPGRHDLAAAALLLACGAAWARPHEYVLGGADAGTYVNVAAHLARTGSLVVHDDWVDLASRHAYTSLRGQPPEMRPRRNQFVGWYVDDADASRVLPQFLPLHPALLAIAIAAGGLRAALFVPPVLAVLGLCGTWLLARRLFGGAVGLAAAAILAACPLTGFFARYPTAEPLSTMLVAAGLLAHLHLRDGEDRSLAFGLLGGSAFGAAALARIDAFPMLPFVAASLAAVGASGGWSRGWTAFAAALCVVGGHAALHLAGPGRYYAWNVFEGPVRALADAARGRPWLAAVPLVAGAALVAALARGRGRATRAQARAPRAHGHLLAAGGPLRSALAAAIVVASLWAWVVRPSAPLDWTLTWPSGNWFPKLDALTWPRVGWYLTPAGVALATLGLAGLVRSGDLGRAGLFAGLGAGTTALYVARLMTTPYQVYAMRRFVPVALPALATFAALALRDLARTARIPRAPLLARVATAALVAALLLRSREILPNRDFAGAIDQLHALDARLRPGAVVLFGERPEMLFADTFGPPLRYVFDHPVVAVRGWDRQVVGLVDDVLVRAAAEGRPVQLVAVDPIPKAIRNNFSLEPAGFVPVRLSMMANTYDRYPGARQEVYHGIDVFDVNRLGRVEEAAPAESDVGGIDTADVVAGFHYKEMMSDGTTARWTDGRGLLALPVAVPGPVEVEVRARVFARPPGAPPEVAVSLDGTEVGSFRAVDEWRTFRFDGVATPFLQRSVVGLESPTFRPADDGSSGDGRRLGVLVDSVRIVPR